MKSDVVEWGRATGAALGIAASSHPTDRDCHFKRELAKASRLRSGASRRQDWRLGVVGGRNRDGRFGVARGAGVQRVATSATRYCAMRYSSR
jgi:hypothetical protein